MAAYRSTPVTLMSEVSVGEFREFVRETGYRTDCEKVGGGWVLAAKRQWIRKSDACWDNPYGPLEENDPVVLVSWYDAVIFANWKSAREGLSPAYAIAGTSDCITVKWNRRADGYRLPTVVEWREAVCEDAGAERRARASRALGPGLPPSPWCEGGAGGFKFEWCWDAEEAAQPDQQAVFFGGRSASTRVCGSSAGDKSVKRDLAKCCACCAPVTAASVLGIRLIRRTR